MSLEDLLRPEQGQANHLPPRLQLVVPSGNLEGIEVQTNGDHTVIAQKIRAPWLALIVHLSHSDRESLGAALSAPSVALPHRAIRR